MIPLLCIPCPCTICILCYYSKQLAPSPTGNPGVLRNRTVGGNLEKTGCIIMRTTVGANCVHPLCVTVVRHDNRSIAPCGFIYRSFLSTGFQIPEKVVFGRTQFAPTLSRLRVVTGSATAYIVDDPGWGGFFRTKNPQPEKVPSRAVDNDPSAFCRIGGSSQAFLGQMVNSPMRCSVNSRSPKPASLYAPAL